MLRAQSIAQNSMDLMFSIQTFVQYNSAYEKKFQDIQKKMFLGPLLYTKISFKIWIILINEKDQNRTNLCLYKSTQK